MDGTKIIKKLLVEAGINTVELARRLGCGTANLYNKYGRNNFSLNELEEIADACGYAVQITFNEMNGGGAVNGFTGSTERRTGGGDYADIKDLSAYARSAGCTEDEYIRQAIAEKMQRQDEEYKEEIEREKIY